MAQARLNPWYDLLDMSTAKIREFGEDILRKTCSSVPAKDFQALYVKELIRGMQELLLSENMGVAIAAPQVGESLAVVVVAVRPTKHRPKVKVVDLVMINPRIVQTFGYRTQTWEGCLSGGHDGLFAKVPRYKKVAVEFFDEAGNRQTEVFTGLLAQIAQHETDHLRGVLFVDRVKDSKTYMTKKQYIRHITPKATKDPKE